jgi:hypothetical protein
MASTSVVGDKSILFFEMEYAGNRSLKSVKGFLFSAKCDRNKAIPTNESLP